MTPVDVAPPGVATLRSLDDYSSAVAGGCGMRKWSVVLRSSFVRWHRGSGRAACTAIALAGAVGLPVASASASRLPEVRAEPNAAVAISIVSGPYKFTADHATWSLIVDASESSSGAQVGAAIIRGSSSAAEEHLYSVSDLPPTTVQPTGVGKWTIAPLLADVSPVFRAFSLTFTAESHAPVACQTGSETTYKGTLTGALRLTTGFSAVGTIGSSSIAFGSANTAVTGSCTTKPVCQTGITWVSASPSGSAVGVSITGIDAVALERTTLLADPAHAARDDLAFATEPSAVLSGKTLYVHTSGSAITGAATMKVLFAEPLVKTSCWLNGVKRVQSATNYFGTFSASPLAANTLLTGVLRSPTSGEGSFVVLSHT